MDFQAALAMDPAATSRIEVALTYAGFHALLFYRFGHWMCKKRIPFIPRALSQFARFITGIEIHPAAVIGSGLFIDHGMGVVIGETTEIGDNVTLFQGVTLGGYREAAWKTPSDSGEPRRSGRRSKSARPDQDRELRQDRSEFSLASGCA